MQLLVCSKRGISLVVALQEVIRIQNAHLDDNQCIVNHRVKGRLQVTRAFGAGFLKQVHLKIVYYYFFSFSKACILLLQVISLPFGTKCECIFQEEFEH